MLAGPVFLVAVVVALGGALKLGAPAPTVSALRAVGAPGGSALTGVVYAMGLFEVALGAAVLAVAGPFAVAVMGVVYLAFAGFVQLARRADSALASCGCFGQADTPPSGLHVVINLASAAIAFAAVAWPVDDLATVLGDQPWFGLPFLAVLGIGVGLVYAALTLVPQLQKVEPKPEVRRFALVTPAGDRKS